jgi:hypothetical protein
LPQLVVQAPANIDEEMWPVAIKCGDQRAVLAGRLLEYRPATNQGSAQGSRLYLRSTGGIAQLADECLTELREVLVLCLGIKLLKI